MPASSMALNTGIQLTWHQKTRSATQRQKLVISGHSISNAWVSALQRTSNGDTQAFLQSAGIAVVALAACPAHQDGNLSLAAPATFTHQRQEQH